MNEYHRIEGIRYTDHPITQVGLTLRYPWKHMLPGEMFRVDDTSAATRSRLSSGAATAGKRMGARFSVGKLYDETTGQHVGYWAARVDGCEIRPAEATDLKARRAAYAREQYRERIEAKRRESVLGGSPIGRVQPLEAVDDGKPPEALRAEDYPDWTGERSPGECF